MDIETRYHIEDLVAASGISRRTIHYYISTGLLPHAQGSGRNGYYTQVHMNRLLRICQLRNQFVVLRDIKQILDDEDKQREQLSVQEDAPQYDAKPSDYPVNITVSIGHGVQVHVPVHLFVGNKKQLLFAIRNFEDAVEAIVEDPTCL